MGEHDIAVICIHTRIHKSREVSAQHEQEAENTYPLLFKAFLAELYFTIFAKDIKWNFKKQCFIMVVKLQGRTALPFALD